MSLDTIFDKADFMTQHYCAEQPVDPCICHNKTFAEAAFLSDTSLLIPLQ